VVGSAAGVEDLAALAAAARAAAVRVEVGRQLWVRNL